MTARVDDVILAQDPNHIRLNPQSPPLELHENTNEKDNEEVLNEFKDGIQHFEGGADPSSVVLVDWEKDWENNEPPQTPFLFMHQTVKKNSIADFVVKTDEVESYESELSDTESEDDLQEMESDWEWWQN